MHVYNLSYMIHITLPVLPVVYDTCVSPVLYDTYMYYVNCITCCIWCMCKTVLYDTYYFSCITCCIWCMDITWPIWYVLRKLYYLMYMMHVYNCPIWYILRYLYYLLFMMHVYNMSYNIWYVLRYLLHVEWRQTPDVPCQHNVGHGHLT